MADLTTLLSKFLAQLSAGLVTDGAGSAPEVPAGTGTATATISGVLTTSTTAAATTAVTTEETLLTYNLPANTLSADGKGIRITAWGTTAANVNSKTVRVKVGATEVAGGASTTSAATWHISVLLIRTGAATEVSHGLALFGTAIAGHDADLSLAEDTTGAIAITVTGQNGVAAANDIVFRGAVVEWL